MKRKWHYAAVILLVPVLLWLAGCVGAPAPKSSASGPAPKATEPLVIADFDKGEPNGNLGSNWFFVPDTDPSNGGNSSGGLTMVTGADGTPNAVRVDYELGPGYQYRYVLLKCEFPKTTDYSPYDALAIKIRGTGQFIKVHIGIYEISDYDYHEYALRKVPAEWTEIVMPFTAFMQEGWGKPKTFNPAHVILMQFQTGSQIVGEKGWFEIDSVRLLPAQVAAK